MKIAVCLKQVPARDSVLRVNRTQSWVEESDIGYQVNEPDVYALEEALRLRENLTGSADEVVVYSLGPARAQQAIKEALAKGADRAFHLDDPAFKDLDAYDVARCLAAALSREKPDLIVTGLQSDDFGFAQTGVILAEIMGLPHCTIIMQIEASKERLRVKRELENGWFQWIEMPLPALLTIQSGINKPRYATLKGIMASKSKPLAKLTLSDLGLSAADIAPRQKITRLYAPVKTTETQFLEGSPKEVAARLTEKLKNEARVI
jgi:electron transfer flavoprotein beta subunit